MSTVGRRCAGTAGERLPARRPSGVLPDELSGVLPDEAECDGAGPGGRAPLPAAAAPTPTPTVAAAAAARVTVDRDRPRSAAADRPARCRITHPGINTADGGDQPMS